MIYAILIKQFLLQVGAHIGGVDCHFIDISCKDNDFFQCGLQIQISRNILVKGKIFVFLPKNFYFCIVNKHIKEETEKNN